MDNTTAQISQNKNPHSSQKKARMGHPVIYGFAGEGFAITAPASVYSLVHE
jgi:hypothetical protein